MKRFLKIRKVLLVLAIVLGTAAIWGFASGDSRSFQLAKNIDIFNSIVKEKPFAKVLMPCFIL